MAILSVYFTEGRYYLYCTKYGKYWQAHFATEAEADQVKSGLYSDWQAGGTKEIQRDMIHNFVNTRGEVHASK